MDGRYLIHPSADGASIHITFNGDGMLQAWEGFVAYYRRYADRGTRFWTLDLRLLTQISSLDIGTLISINAGLMKRDGLLTVIVASGSPIQTLFQQVGLERVFNVIEQAPENSSRHLVA